MKGSADAQVGAPSGSGQFLKAFQANHMETYKDSGLHPDIIRGVEALGFVEPTPIQKMSIEHLLEEPTDLIAFAQTGTGKTAAFSTHPPST